MDVTASEPSVSYDERTGWTGWMIRALTAHGREMR